MSDEHNKRKPPPAELRVANRLEELGRLHTFLTEAASRDGWPEKLRNDFLLCCDELLTNTIRYGFPQGGAHEIVLTARTEDGIVTVTLEDGGLPFNPLEQAAEPDVTLGVEEREIGGLGVFFVKKLMDGLLYERTAAGNRLVLTKAITR